MKRGEIPLFFEVICLRELKKDIFYIEGSTNVGVVISGSDAIVVDTGIDDSIAKKILRSLKEFGVKVSYILNTHSHADHIGGNAFLKKKTSAELLVPEGERVFVENPFLEPWYLFCGASYPKDLDVKFLKAKPSKVDGVLKEGKIKLLDIELEVVSLPGHSLDHIGIVVDGVCFCGDSAISEEVLEKYKVPFNTDIELQKRTLKFLSENPFEMYVPSHAKPSRDISKLALLNLRAIERVENFIIDILKTPKTTEEVVVAVSEWAGVPLRSPVNYHLAKTAIVAYLSHLRNGSILEYSILRGRPIWSVTSH